MPAYEYGQKLEHQRAALQRSKEIQWHKEVKIQFNDDGTWMATCPSKTDENTVYVLTPGPMGSITCDCKAGIWNKPCIHQAAVYTVLVGLDKLPRPIHHYKPRKAS